jgi:prepilin-type N-terminal cleavage/methylation domain-containing protein
MPRKINNNKGFTLIEVVTAFAVLAILSGTLLQMFVVSAKTNRKAYDMDKANVKAVEIGERYKVNPDEVQNFPELAGPNADVFTEPSSGVTTYTNYYNSDWIIESTANPGKYMLEVIVQPLQPIGAMEASYHPDTLTEWIGVLNSSMNTVFNLYVSNPGGNLEFFRISMEGNMTLDIPMPANGVIPLKMQYDINYTNNIIINVFNSAQYNDTVARDAKVDIYLFDVPAGVDVTYVPKSGNSSYSEVNSSTSTAAFYSAVVRWTRLDDSTKLAEYYVNRYYTK